MADDKKMTQCEMDMVKGFMTALTLVESLVQVDRAAVFKKAEGVMSGEDRLVDSPAEEADKYQKWVDDLSADERKKFIGNMHANRTLIETHRAACAAFVKWSDIILGGS